MPSTSRPARSARPIPPWRGHLRRALGEEINELARPLDRARSRALLLAVLGIALAGLLGAGAAFAYLTAAPTSAAHVTGDAVCVGLLTLVGLSVLVAAGLGRRLDTLDRRADQAWQHSWARLEPDWSGRASRKPRTDDTQRG
ncbi:hypothetical protein [Streptomyces sp. NRRL WC-3742]|uniref:hypothetical protein n=1 Tax=Streptomyces sp. NRRL WC-3742 TaxID=1463934 RepID=UPI0004C5F979|nr:hypothetical protein [Streptomyces sp. NRRL WC-3742]